MQMIEKSQEKQLEATSFPVKGYRAYFFIWGLAVWAAATVVLRLTGQYLFDPANVLMVVIVFAATPPGLLALSYLLFRQKRLTLAGRYQATIWLALPGIFLDVVGTVFFTTIFPNMASSMQGVFGGWLLFSYGTILLAPVVLPATSKQ